MNIFDIASQLQALQNKIEAPQVEISVRIDRTPIKTIDVRDISKILTTKDGLLTNGKNGFVVYIYDQHSVNQNGKIQVDEKGNSEYRFHLHTCQTIQKYQQNGLYKDKYVIHEVSWGNVTKARIDNDKIEVVKMKPCKHCLNELNWSGYRYATQQERLRIWNTFDMNKDYKDYFNNLPGTEYSSLCVPHNDYPTNWNAISANLRHRIGECEFCGETSDLQVHHINGDRSNCNNRNLIVLCEDCHKKIHERPATLTTIEYDILQNRQQKGIPYQ